MKKTSNIIAKSIFVVLIFFTLGVIFAITNKDDRPKDTLYEDTLEQEKRKAEGDIKPVTSEELDYDFDEYVMIYKKSIEKIDNGIGGWVAEEVLDDIKDKREDIDNMNVKENDKEKQYYLSNAYGFLEQSMILFGQSINVDDSVRKNKTISSYNECLNTSKACFSKYEDLIEN